MATYVVSDVHGHAAALHEVLSKAPITSDDTLYVLGDMVDRGPRPLDVVRTFRSMPNCEVLMGNHEQLMLGAIDHTDFAGVWDDWAINGGEVTALDLQTLAPEAYETLISWVRHLPLYKVVNVPRDDAPQGRLFLLCHAGVNPRPSLFSSLKPPADARELEAAAAAQDPETLTWVRHEFWGRHTGLMGSDGQGAVVVAGHTPSPLAYGIADEPEVRVLDIEDHALMGFFGADQSTGGQADRICTDCAAASGHGVGQVGILRLEDYATWYAPIHEGE